VIVVRHLALQAALRASYAQPSVGTQPRHEEPTHPAIAHRLVVDYERPTHRGEVELPADVVRRQVDCHLVTVGSQDYLVATDGQAT
jgi:hypothetical protein